MRGEGSWGSSTIQEGCDGRSGAEGGYGHWEGCLGKGKAAAPSAFEGSRGKLCWDGLSSDGAQGEEKDLMDLRGSSSPGCCNSVGLTKDENAPNMTLPWSRGEHSNCNHPGSGQRGLCGGYSSP